jgi:hypothetical protein
MLVRVLPEARTATGELLLHLQQLGIDAPQVRQELGGKLTAAASTVPDGVIDSRRRVA